LFEAFARGNRGAVIVLRRDNRRSNAEVLMIEAFAWPGTPDSSIPGRTAAGGGAWAVARQGTPMLCSTGRRLGMTGPSAWKRLPRTPVGHKQQAVNGSCQVGYFRLRSSRYQNESP
jgi:hypothetical protein